MQLVSWQSVLTEHQIHLMRAIRETLKLDLIVVAGSRSLNERSAQGWTEIDSSSFEFITLPKQGWWKIAVNVIQENRNAVHLFCGIFADPRFFWLMLYCRGKGIKFALMSEPYAETAIGYFGEQLLIAATIKVYLRPLIYRLARIFIGRKLFAIFPISSFAIKQFKRNGFRAGGYYPFAYFVPKLTERAEIMVTAPELQAIRIIFVGNLIKTKGIHILLAAWRDSQASLRESNARMILDIYGAGEVDKCDLPPNAYFRGSIPFGHAQPVIAQYDALVLPSLHDGWGVVVNEALLQGVPALVSDSVGAQALVLAGNAGSVFKSGSVSALAKLFVDLATDSAQLEEWAIGARKIAPRLNPLIGAEYLLACLEHAKSGVGAAPLPPWVQP